MSVHSAPEGSGTADPPALFAPDALEHFVSALERLANAAQTGSAPPRLDELPPFGAADIRALHDSLVHDS